MKKNLLILISVIVLCIILIVCIMIQEDPPRKNKLTKIDIASNQNIGYKLLKAPLEKNFQKEYFNLLAQSGIDLSHTQSAITHFFSSPSGIKFGFMKIDNNVSIYLVDKFKKDFKKIFSGSLRTSGWEWFNEDKILVSYNCGTECQMLYLIDTRTNKQNQLVYGVNYEWSPNKEMVSAHNYYPSYGVTVGTQFGEKIFSIQRSIDDTNETILNEKTNTSWSPDSSKLAVVIKKEDNNQMELLVLDVENKFKKILRNDLPTSVDYYDVKWDNNGQNIILNNISIPL